MKILFTGASSFTGYWFVKYLSESNNQVYCVFTKNGEDEYDGIRRERVNDILKYCTPLWNCKFGDLKFIKLLTETSFNILCHHAADVTNYKSPDFDFLKALKNNTNQIKDVLLEGAKYNLKAVILTGSIFEQNEGYGISPLRAFSSYGLSKGLTSQVFEYYSEILGVKLGKFVIPNPFGPFEDERFTNYLISSWVKNRTPKIMTPAYIRDNIHVTLLAKAYNLFCNDSVKSDASFKKIHPSEYIETQADFAKRFAGEISNRLKINCQLDFAEQTEFKEPLLRFNSDNINWLLKENLEENAWDQLAEYYQAKFKL